MNPDEWMDVGMIGLGPDLGFCALLRIRVEFDSWVGVYAVLMIIPINYTYSRRSSGKLAYTMHVYTIHNYPCLIGNSIEDVYLYREK